MCLQKLDTPGSNKKRQTTEQTNAQTRNNNTRENNRAKTKGKNKTTQRIAKQPRKINIE